MNLTSKQLQILVEEEIKLILEEGDLDEGLWDKLKAAGKAGAAAFKSAGGKKDVPAKKSTTAPAASPEQEKIVKGLKLSKKLLGTLRDEAKNPKEFANMFKHVIDAIQTAGGSVDQKLIDDINSKLIKFNKTWMAQVAGKELLPEGPAEERARIIVDQFNKFKLDVLQQLNQIINAVEKEAVKAAAKVKDETEAAGGAESGEKSATSQDPTSLSEFRKQVKALQNNSEATAGELKQLISNLKIPGPSQKRQKGIFYSVHKDTNWRKDNEALPFDTKKNADAYFSELQEFRGDPAYGGRPSGRPEGPERGQAPVAGDAAPGGAEPEAGEDPSQRKKGPDFDKPGKGRIAVTSTVRDALKAAGIDDAAQIEKISKIVKAELVKFAGGKEALGNLLIREQQMDDAARKLYRQLKGRGALRSVPAKVIAQIARSLATQLKDNPELGLGVGKKKPGLDFDSGTGEPLTDAGKEKCAKNPECAEKWMKGDAPPSEATPADETTSAEAAPEEKKDKISVFRRWQTKEFAGEQLHKYLQADKTTDDKGKTNAAMENIEQFFDQIRDKGPEDVNERKLDSLLDNLFRTLKRDSYNKQIRASLKGILRSFKSNPEKYKLLEKNKLQEAFDRKNERLYKALMKKLVKNK